MNTVTPVSGRHSRVMPNQLWLGVTQVNPNRILFQTGLLNVFTLGSAHEKINVWNQVVPESFWVTAAVDFLLRSASSRTYLIQMSNYVLHSIRGYSFVRRDSRMPVWIECYFAVTSFADFSIPSCNIIPIYYEDEITFLSCQCNEFNNPYNVFCMTRIHLGQHRCH